MTIDVLFFGSLANDVGATSYLLILTDNTTVSDALDALEAEFDALQKYRPLLATAVNHEYAGTDHPLRDGDELALIPPVSGG